MGRKLHPEQVGPRDDFCWARIEGTRGDLFHIYDGDINNGVPKSMCGKVISYELRGAPTRSAYPQAKACDDCVRICAAIKGEE